MKTIAIASAVIVMLAQPSFAFDPQPDPPKAANQNIKSQPVAKPTGGRMFPDYNIQKEAT